METTKDSLLYALEVSESTVANNTLREALNAACDAIRERMLAYPADNTGILLYGVSGAKHNCRTLLDLKPQDSSGVKLLFRLLEDESFFAKEIVPAGPGATSIGDVFFQAGVLFEQERAKSFRRLVLVTDCDQPHEPKSRLAEVAKIKSYDLVQKNVTIVPVFINRPGAKFDVTKFWEDFYFTPDFYIDSNEVKLEPVNGSPQDILAAVTSQEVPRRPLLRTQLEFGGLRIDVRAFTIYKTQKVGQTYLVSVDTEKPTVSTSKTTYVVEESAREVERDELSRAFDFGKDRLVVEPEMLEKLHDFGKPGIRIIGFQDRSDTVPSGHIAHSLFLYPWDVVSKGSVRAFIALWRSLLSKNKMAIVLCVLRANSTPTLGALYPSREQTTGDGRQISPPGLHLVFLPFMDDIRDMPQNVPHVSAGDELVDAMGSVIEALTMPQGYTPTRYRNPKLLWVNSVVEAQALSREMPEGAIDGTLPKYKSIETRAGASIATVNAALHAAVGDIDEPDESKPKRPKIADEDVSLELARELSRNGSLSQLTVPQLLSVAERLELKVPSRRTKQTIVNAIQDHFG